jgi:parvulin-like peptidyl-prolyl isomerase
MFFRRLEVAVLKAISVPRRRALGSLVLALGLTLALVACREREAAPTAAPTAAVPPGVETDASPVDSAGQATLPPAVTVEPTRIPPTPTPTEPLAALVNGQPVFLADYEKELARYEQAQADLGITAVADGTDHRAIVLDALIETELIAQAAAASGQVVTPEMVAERLASLIESAGGAENFAAWLESNQWTEEEFREALGREMVTEMMVELVTADVPFEVEQVHARYIQVDDQALADSILAQLRAEADFAALAQQHSLDRITGENGGDLGFFARGSLLVPAVEEAAFALEVNEISEVIAAPGVDGSGTTYYIVQVLERDPQRPLDAEMRFNLLQERFEAWLAEQWTQAQVERFVEAGA